MPAPPASQDIVGGTPPGDMSHAAKVPLMKRYLRWEARRQRLKGGQLTMHERDRLGATLSALSPEGLRHETRHLRRNVHRLQRKIDRERHGGAPDIPIPGALQSIAQCESHGNPRAVDASGTYRGKYQFDYGTWASVGGEGDPAAASETEQDRRAALLYSRSGTTPWPVCGSA